MLDPRPSAPLAATGLVLGALAIVGLAAGPEPVEPTRDPPAPRSEPTAASAPLARGEPLDLNEASAADLELLPRIGPTLAARIVAVREAEGPFEAVDQLVRVRGIGPRTLERLRPHLRVAANASDSPLSP